MRTVPVLAARWTVILVWVLRIVVAGLFLSAAFFKLSGQPMMVEEFGHIGLGQWFRIFTGLIELTGGVLTLVPAVSVFGALLLLAVDIGAFVTQAAILHGDIIHTIVIGAVVVVLVYLQRSNLRRP